METEEAVTEDDFLSYEDVRVSGQINMFDVRMVEMLSGLTREQIKYIMKNYGTLKDQYLEKEKE